MPSADVIVVERGIAFCLGKDAKSRTKNEIGVLMINENGKYSIHWARFETAWHAFCEENHFDTDDKQLRKIWEEAYFDGAVDVLEGLEVIKGDYNGRK